MRATQRTLACAAGLGLTAMGGAASAQQGFGDPKLPEGQTRQAAPHAWVIMGFPNIGIVVGDKAILVVDTGLGAANGATIAREARKLSTKGQRLILTTTHVHPEHASGQGGFPSGTRVIRPKAQGLTAAEAGRQIQAEFEKTYAGWQGLGNVPHSVQRAFADPR